MAETDRLELEIATKIDGNDADKVKALALGIRSLNNAVKNFNTTNFAKVITKMSNSLETFSASIEKCYKGLSNIAKVMGKSDLKTLTAQMEAVTNTTASDNVSKRAEELKQLDIYKLKLGDVEKALQDETLTEEKRHSLLGQRLNLLENIRKYEVSTAKGSEIIPESELNLTLDKIALLKNQVVLIDEKIKTGNINEERKNSLLQQRISILSQINKAQEKAKKISDLPQLGTELIDTGDTIDGTPAPKIKPVDNELLNRNVQGHRLLASAIKDENKEKEKSGKNGKKLSIKELSASIKRVAVYRAIRAVLKDVASAMQNAFSYASQNIPEFNQSFSQIKSSLAVINGSVGVLATALLPIIQPLLTGIASVIATIANSISKASAALRGQNTYLKVNKDYWKDQKDQMNGSLLAFDTFTTLSQQTADMTGLFENAKMTNEEMKATANKARTILTVVISIGAALAAIKALNILDEVKDTLKNVKKIDDKTATIYATIAAISFLVANIIAVIKNPDLTGWQKFAALLTGALATAFAIMAVLQFTKWGWKGAIIAGAFAGGVMTWASSLVATKFADGGMFEGAGTMYAIAGESGAEVVAKGSQGTGVLNVEQFKTAMVQAFYEYGAARGDLSAASVTLNGEKVGKMTASSSYREMVRQGLL